MWNVYSLPFSLLLPSYSYKYSQLCILLPLTELSLKTSNSSFIFKHHYFTHLLLKAKVLPIMILIPTRDMQQLKCISINPKKKGIWWKEVSVNSKDGGEK